MHLLTYEVYRAVGYGMDKSKCGCLVFITYRLSCVCVRLPRRSRTSHFSVWMKFTLTEKGRGSTMKVILRIERKIYLFFH